MTKNGSRGSCQIFHMQMIYRDVFVKSKHEHERKSKIEKKEGHNKVVK